MEIGIKVSAKRTMVGLALVALMGGFAYTDDASAHTGDGWSAWRTTSGKYEEVRHKHVDTGTICQGETVHGNRVETFKLATLNARSSDCSGHPTGAII